MRGCHRGLTKAWARQRVCSALSEIRSRLVQGTAYPWEVPFVMGKVMLRRQKMFPHPGKGNLHSQAVLPSRPWLVNPSHPGHGGALCRKSSSQLVQPWSYRVLQPLMCIPAAIPEPEPGALTARGCPGRSCLGRCPIVFQPELGHATTSNQAWHSR